MVQKPMVEPGRELLALQWKMGWGAVVVAAGRVEAAFFAGYDRRLGGEEPPGRGAGTYPRAAVDGGLGMGLTSSAMLTAVAGLVRGLRGVSSGKAATKEAAVAKRTKRHLSPEARQRMAEAQLKRWAKQPAEA
jgi:hypothetical protein